MSQVSITDSWKRGIMEAEKRNVWAESVQASGNPKSGNTGERKKPG